MTINLMPALDSGITISYTSIYDAICNKTDKMIDAVKTVIFDGNIFKCTYWGGTIDGDGYPDIAEFDIDLTIEDIK